MLATSNANRCRGSEPLGGLKLFARFALVLGPLRVKPSVSPGSLLRQVQGCQIPSRIQGLALLQVLVELATFSTASPSTATPSSATPSSPTPLRQRAHRRLAQHCGYRRAAGGDQPLFLLALKGRAEWTVGCAAFRIRMPTRAAARRRATKELQGLSAEKGS